MQTLQMPDYTTKEAAKLLGIHPKYIFSMHKTGKIRFTLDITGRYRVPMGEVWRILSEKSAL
jgi:excisionase family DNA binding protein